jgi:TPR repeat protein
MKITQSGFLRSNYLKAVLCSSIGKRLSFLTLVAWSCFSSSLCADTQAEENYQSAKAYMSEEGEKKINLVHAYELMRAAADQGHVEAQATVGYLLYTGTGVARDEKDGVRFLKQAGDGGSPKAAFNLAKILLKQNPQNSPDALAYMKKAADSGMLKAELTIAEWYYFGENGIPVNYPEALRFYERAAEKGNAVAENAIGAMYYYGTGVPNDTAKGTRYFQKAAEKGMARAQVHLAHVYLMGDTLPRSKVEALKWIFRANVQGEVTARVTLRDLLTGITEAEISQALKETGLNRADAMNIDDDKAPPPPRY